MSLFSFLFGDTQSTRLNLAPVAAKGAFSALRVGAGSGRVEPPATDTNSLIEWHQRHELVYACCEKIAQAAVDPELVVERFNRKTETYERDTGHRLERLIARPNPAANNADFVTAWLVSLHVAGVFYAEIVRDRSGLPAQLWPLNPARVLPVVSEGSNEIVAYEFRDTRHRERLPAEDVFAHRFYDPASSYSGLSPLQVALGAVDMDRAMTDYVRQFFAGGGVPSGIIRILNRTVPQAEADSLIARWMMKYRRGSSLQQAPAVLDQNAEYQKVGANLNEIANESLRENAEARICSVFGVPPILVGALVGLKHQNNRASARAAQSDLWENKLSPLFKRMRIALQWRLLTEFVAEELIHSGEYRLAWDMSRVSALQEDVDAIQKRARDNFSAGFITVNEARASVGLDAVETGGVFYVPVRANVVAEDDLESVMREAVVGAGETTDAGTVG